MIAARLQAYSEADSNDSCYEEQTAFVKVSCPPIPPREIAKEET